MLFQLLKVFLLPLEKLLLRLGPCGLVYGGGASVMNIYRAFHRSPGLGLARINELVLHRANDNNGCISCILIDCLKEMFLGFVNHSSGVCLYAEPGAMISGVTLACLDF